METIISQNDFETEILRLFKEYGIVNKNIWNKYSVYKDKNFNHYRNKYGGIKNILKKFRIEYIYYNQTTKEEVINRANELFKEHGFISKELCTKNNISSSTVRRYFGGFNKMFEELGFPVKMPRFVTKEDLLEDILLFFQENGVTSSIIYRKYGKYGQGIIDKYGGWEQIMDELNIKKTGNSSAENVIEEYLKNNNIRYRIHYNFDWLVSDNNRKMFVDFYLVDYNIVIEYDGEQHYKFVPYFHKTIEKFEECKKRDILKEKLLEQHHIKVFRIKFDENIMDRINIILTLI